MCHQEATGGPPVSKANPQTQGFGLGGIRENAKKIRFALWTPATFRSMWGRGEKRGSAPQMKEKSRWFAKDPKEAKLRFSSIPFPSQPSLGPLGDRKAEK